MVRLHGVNRPLRVLVVQIKFKEFIKIAILNPQLFICACENIPTNEPKEEEKRGWS